MTENERPQGEGNKKIEPAPQQQPSPDQKEQRDEAHPSKHVHRHTAEELHGPSAEHD